jgi:release factor glutamine methyltransferase
MFLRRFHFAGCCAAAGLLAVGAGAAWFLRPAAAPVEPESRVVSRVNVLDFEEQLVLFDTVFWEPDDTKSLRDVIRVTPLVKGKDVLEIGTGSGLISLCCAKAGANRVVATDINPNAVANARYNAQRLGFADCIEVRQVAKSDPGAYAVLKSGEKFDVIISNPPWEDRRPTSIGKYALDDEGFALMRSILKDLKTRLNPGGRAFLAYGCVSAIKTLKKLAPEYGLAYQVFDNRKLSELDEVFLPGMLVIVWPREP